MPWGEWPTKEVFMVLNKLIVSLSPIVDGTLTGRVVLGNDQPEAYTGTKSSREKKSVSV